MTDVRPARRRGRPSKVPTKGTRVPLSLRVTPETKTRLDRAAELSGRSQSQEAEFRLDRSFEREDLLPELLSARCGPQLAGVLMLLVTTLRSVQFQAGARRKEHREMSAADMIDTGSLWEITHPKVYAEIEKAAEVVFKGLRPPVSADEFESLDWKPQEHGGKTIGEWWGTLELLGLQRTATHPEVARITNMTRKLLGPLALPVLGEREIRTRLAEFSSTIDRTLSDHINSAETADNLSRSGTSRRRDRKRQ